MIKISDEEVTLHINDLGFIEKWSHGDTFLNNPSYMVFFKDYSRLDPFCRNWDTSQNIQDIVYRDKKLSFTKKIEDVEISSKITANPEGWEWVIEIQGEYPQGHRFGVAAAVVSGDLRTIDKRVCTTVSQYHRLSHEMFRDQTFLELPILFYQSDTLFAVFSDMQTDSQFFVYDDNGPFIRSTVSTCLSKRTVISARIAKNIKHLKSMFINSYPKADAYLNKWKPIFDQLCKQQQIEIVYQTEHKIHELFEGEVKMAPVNEDHLEKYANLAKEELAKYPSGFLQDIGIKGFILCGDILLKKTNASKKLHGMILCTNGYWILWDVANRNRYPLHHEIFHALQNRVPIETGGFCLLSMPSEDPFEHAADLFAIMMTDRSRAIELSKQHEWCRKQSANIISSLNLEILNTKKRDNDTFEHRVIWAVSENESVQITFGEMPDFSGSIEFRTELT